MSRRRPTRVLVSCNDAGYAIGESHQRAKLTDEDVALILELHEMGLSYSAIAGKFDPASISRTARS